MKTELIYRLSDFKPVGISIKFLWWEFEIMWGICHLIEIWRRDKVYPSLLIQKFPHKLIIRRGIGL